MSFYSHDRKLFVPQHLCGMIGFIVGISKIKQYLSNGILLEMQKEARDFDSIVLDYRDLCYYLTYFHNNGLEKSDPLYKEGLIQTAKLMNDSNLCYVDDSRNAW